MIQVYPRVGGETGGRGCKSGRREGLSPRGRGNLLVADQHRFRSGSIPAWAGKPTWPESNRRPSAVYPRVGGETCKGIYEYQK